MILNLTKWLTRPAARRYVTITLFFVTLSSVMTVYKVTNGWGWLLVCSGWLWAEEVFAKGHGLSIRTQIMIIGGLLLFDVVLTLFTGIG